MRRTKVETSTAVEQTETTPKAGLKRLKGLYGKTARMGSLALVDQAAVSGTNFFTGVMIGRFCGPDELGIYALGLSLATLIVEGHGSLVASPYTVYGNRLEGRARDEYAGSVLGHHGLLTCLAVACLLVAGVVVSAGIGPAGLARLIWVLAGVIAFILLREFGRRMSFAHLNVSTALAIDLVVSSIQVVGIVLLAAAGALSACTAYAVIGLGCAVAGIGWFALSHRKFVVKRERISVDLRRNWSLGRWVFAERTTGTLRHSINPWLLALLIGETATGTFSACKAVILASNPFVLGVGNVLTARTAQAFSTGGVEELRHVVRKAGFLFAVTMSVFCSLIAIFGGYVVVLLYGSRYAGHGYTVAVLAAATLAWTMAHPFACGLLAMERSDDTFKVRLLALSTAVVVSPVLILSLGILGAAYALLTGNLVAAVAMYCFYRRVLGKALPAAEHAGDRQLLVPGPSADGVSESLVGETGP